MTRRRNDQGKFMQSHDEAVAQAPICVRFPLSVDRILKDMPNKSDFIRNAVIEKLNAAGLRPAASGE